MHEWPFATRCRRCHTESAALPASRLIEPRVEVELALVPDRPLARSGGNAPCARGAVMHGDLLRPVTTTAYGVYSPASLGPT